MALPAVDMDSCCKKQRCLSGPNAGQVYDSCNPCQGLGDFNSETCDCEQSELCVGNGGGSPGACGFYSVTGTEDQYGNSLDDEREVSAGIPLMSCVDDSFCPSGQAIVYRRQVTDVNGNISPSLTSQVRCVRGDAPVVWSFDEPLADFNCRGT